jgi:hypothetical protein
MYIGFERKVLAFLHMMTSIPNQAQRKLNPNSEGERQLF